MSYLEKHELLFVQLVGCIKSHYRHLNLNSKHQIKLSRGFSSSKALNKLFFFVHIIIYIYTHTQTDVPKCITLLRNTRTG